MNIDTNNIYYISSAVFSSVLSPTSEGVIESSDSYNLKENKNILVTFEKNSDGSYYIKNYKNNFYFTVGDTYKNKDNYSIVLKNKPSTYSKFKIHNFGNIVFIQGLSPKDNKFYYTSIFKNVYGERFVLSQGYDYNKSYKKENFHFYIHKSIYKPNIIFDENKFYNIRSNKKLRNLINKNNIIYSDEKANLNTEKANFKFKSVDDDTFYILYRDKYFTVSKNVVKGDNDSYTIILTDKPTMYSKFKIHKYNENILIQGLSPIDNKWYFTSIWNDKGDGPFVFSQGYTLPYSIDKNNFQFSITESPFKPVTPFPEIESKSIFIKPEGYDMILNHDTVLLGTEQENRKCFTNNKFEIIRSGIDHFKIKLKDQDKYLRYYSKKTRQVVSPISSEGNVPSQIYVYEDTKLYFDNLNIPDKQTFHDNNDPIDNLQIEIVYNTRFNIIKKGSLYKLYLRENNRDNEIGIVTKDFPQEKDTIYIKRNDYNGIKFEKLFPTMWDFIILSDKKEHFESVENYNVLLFGLSIGIPLFILLIVFVVFCIRNKSKARPTFQLY